MTRARFATNRPARRGKRASRSLPILFLLVAAGALGACKSRFPAIIQINTGFLQAPVVISMAAGGEGSNAAAALALAEIRRLEAVFNPLNTSGSLYRLNETRTLSDPELYPLLERAQWIAELTDGGLNLFLGYLELAYGFRKEFPRPPGPEALRELLLSLRRARMELVRERQEIRIPNDAYAISLTGIQDGFAADQALAHLVLGGVQVAKVQVGSHVACGASPDGLGWPVRISHPSSGEVAVQLFVEHGCVATASVKDQAYVFRDETYHIHLDPTTGLPSYTLSLVAVVAPSCELAGSLAKGVFVLGADKGLQILNDLPEVEGLLLEPDGRMNMTDSLSIWLGG